MVCAILWYLQIMLLCWRQRPGCFFFVGAAKPGAVLPHHKSVFDFDERVMLVTASILVRLVRTELA